MRSRKTDLTNLLKMGLSAQADGSSPALCRLKNLRTDGAGLRSCADETVALYTTECVPFTMGSADYLAYGTGVFKLNVPTAVTSAVFVGRKKIVDLTDVVWIQDDEKTIFMDSSGVYLTNPSGNTIPLCNDIVVWNGQIICIGLKDNSLGLNIGDNYIIWSNIGSDSFDINEENVAGFYNGNIGEVFRILWFDKTAVVLGNLGGYFMTYAEQTFGFMERGLPALKAKALAARGRSFALYIDQTDSLIQLQSDGSAKNLGFSWLCKDVTEILYLKSRDWFILQTADNSIVIDSEGVFSFGHKIWGAFNSGLVVNIGFEQNTCEFQTNLMDLTGAGLKLLSEVYVQSNQDAKVLGSITCENEQGFDNGCRELNSLRSCKYPLTGERLQFTFTIPPVCYIDKFVIETVELDKRYGNGIVPFQGYQR